MTRTAADPVGKLLLGLAAVAVMFAAADTYVVVLALPAMMTSAGLSAEELQRAAPVISGFLLGYVAVLPLVGRIADLRGRLPVLVGSLVLFALGSLVTAAAYDLPSMVAGRVVQGIGGGGLVPATLALVADLYPPHRRGLPLGVVGAVQELGSVLGPLYGALVLALGSWRDIFWVNLAAGLLLAAVIRRTGPARRTPDVTGLLLLAGVLAGVLMVMLQPPALADDVTLGLALLPLVGSSRWASPIAVVALVLAALLLARCLLARRPLVDLRSWRETVTRVDVLAAALLAVALGGIILTFATADPAVQVISPAGPWLLVTSALAAAAFWWRNRRVADPLVPRGALAATPAWGALLVSFFLGSALIAALVDVPVFARVTVYGDSQLMAALVLLRFLLGLPVGALLGGWWTHRAPAGLVTATGMLAATVGFAWMSQWGPEALRLPVATVPLALAGVGLGLAVAPVNAALLAATAAPVHGVSSALLVVARTVGMLVGISALTTVGLRRYYAAQQQLPSPDVVCAAGRTRCPRFVAMLQEAGLTQLHTIFVGAAVCCVIAGVLALLVLSRADTREVQTHPLRGGLG